ncbi:MAG TPA: class I SAM-dependent methyltransferase [Nocardioidaceae bacterium]|nr:class I SAM-dependent methyltransferase [Nocardioidaceae bacterium]
MGEQVRHPVFAWFYARLSEQMEQTGLAQIRQRMLAGVSGDVVEVGAGNGLNFAHYPPTVAGVVAVEPEPSLRRRAEAAASAAPVPVRVVAGTAARLPLRDNSCDAVVVSLVLCSVTDQHAALAEIGRVLRPGGRLHFFEHVRSEHRAAAQVQRFLDATVWPRLFGGCHSGRDTVTAIEAAGFEIEELERMRFPENGVPMPTVTHVLGRARRP